MPSLEESRARLKEHFPEETATHGSRWEDLWAAGDFLPWDRQAPNPALVDLLGDRQDLLGPPIITFSDGTSRRRRALVPGCGRGYDVLLLASFGYDAVGLEVSPSAAQRCVEEQKAKASEYPVRNESVGAGTASFVVGDFFKDEWRNEALPEGKADLIYDYTFLSALPISLRPSWALRMSQLLTDDGRLVCIEFPSTKDPKMGGPPWALPPTVYTEHLGRPGELLPYDPETGHVIGDEQRPMNPAALIRKEHWQPVRTHEVGKGTDWISIWQHLDAVK